MFKFLIGLLSISFCIFPKSSFATETLLEFSGVPYEHCISTTSVGVTFEFHVYEPLYGSNGLIPLYYPPDYDDNDRAAMNRLATVEGERTIKYRDANNGTLNTLDIGLGDEDVVGYYRFKSEFVKIGLIYYEYENEVDCVQTNPDPIFIKFDEGTLTKFCENEWTKKGVLDDRMFNHCMKKQKTAFQELKTDSEKEPFFGVLHTINEAKEDGKWRDFINFKTVSWRLKDQRDSFEDLVWKWQNNSGETKKRISLCLVEITNILELDHKRISRCEAE